MCHLTCGLYSLLVQWLDFYRSGFLCSLSLKQTMGLKYVKIATSKLALREKRITRPSGTSLLLPARLVLFTEPHVQDSPSRYLDRGRKREIIG